MNEIQARVAGAFKEEYREQVAGQLAAFQDFLAPPRLAATTVPKSCFRPVFNSAGTC